MAKRIYLRRSGSPQQFTLVDAKQYAKMAAFRWYVAKTGYVYRYTAAGHRVYMHHEVLPPPEGLSVDHRNRDTLDNRRRNLRLLTASQQQFNQGPRRHNTTGFKGVTRDGSRWKAQIQAQGRQYNLGRFPNPLDAALAYDAAARRLHGRYAYQNFQRTLP